MVLSHCIKHFFLVHPRLIMANLAGLLCFLLLPDSFSLSMRGIISWNLLAWIYLLALWILILRGDAKRIHQIARLQDESAFTVLIMVSIGCIASLLVIFLELSTIKQQVGIAKIEHIVLTVSTLLASWLLVPTAFAIHYAHLFYRTVGDAKPLLFPDKPVDPGYWDFLYFSFTIAVASQTADVAVNNSNTRRIVLLQSILSFVFNISILGLCVNVSASLI